MLNRQYVLAKLNPYLNSAREISAEEFEMLFSYLTKKEQYQVIDIMIDNDIEYVDEKNPEETRSEITQTNVAKVFADPKKYLSYSSAMLCRLYQEGRKDALEILIIKNEKYVRHVAKKIMNNISTQSLSEEELFQEGVIGLIKAAELFDVKRDNAFLTYASSWIKQAIYRAIFNTGYRVRMPVHMMEKIFRIKKIENKYNGISTKELVIKINEAYPNNQVTFDEVHDALIYADIYLNMASLNAEINDEGDSELIEFVEDKSVDLPDKVCATREFSKVINNLLKRKLSSRETMVLFMRYGFLTGRPMTLQEIGIHFNVSRERVRQIEEKALKKLHKKEVLKTLTSFLGE